MNRWRIDPSYFPVSLISPQSHHITDKILIAGDNISPEHKEVRSFFDGGLQIRRDALRRQGLSEATKTTVQLPFSLHIRVNNIQGRENQTKTPEKWGKNRLRIFP